MTREVNYENVSRLKHTFTNVGKCIKLKPKTFEWILVWVLEVFECLDKILEQVLREVQIGPSLEC
jgi:hypothetical protein